MTDELLSARHGMIAAVATSISPSHDGESAFEAFGVRVRVTADTPEILARVQAIFPPGAKPCPASSADASFGVTADDDGSYRFTYDGRAASTGLDLEFALLLLDRELASYVGVHAPHRIFVHAGVVGHEGKAIVMPGMSMVGKTTLVLELVRAGAVYYSDEFAVIDNRGLVHAYSRPPSPRNGAQGEQDATLEGIDRPPGGEPLPIGAVVLTAYRAQAKWKPTRLSAASGVLAMLANTLAAMDRSEEALRTIGQALNGVLILEGERGEASETAPQLLGALVG